MCVVCVCVCVCPVCVCVCVCVPACKRCAKNQFVSVYILANMCVYANQSIVHSELNIVHSLCFCVHISIS